MCLGYRGVEGRYSCRTDLVGSSGREIDGGLMYLLN